ncbi:hypothetical protein KIN20_033501 [Parelaphostrongylus tenuis]|uniref:Uncharacterized protein n=1 Tax=Parelaphostrongylus tenuis TaxID=148309 RepID=A0AAD5MAB3_PARTN|nr:hypothetical protein KIN20_008846 [Parelaphostrongylus tenuis]KAJ1371535.1 hypothetical protein KIN20_033501 [Parelaphostrongylus tenuis]
MATTAKNSSFYSSLVNSVKSQVNQLGFATTSAYEESPSTASKDTPKTGNAQDLCQRPRDWKHKDYLFKLAYVFHTNNY